MASANPACRLQTATHVRLWGLTQTLCSVTPCTQKHSASQCVHGEEQLLTASHLSPAEQRPTAK